VHRGYCLVNEVSEVNTVSDGGNQPSSFKYSQCLNCGKRSEGTLASERGATAQGVEGRGLGKGVPLS